MKTQNITLVYFIEDDNQEKILYLKYKDTDSDILLIYSNLKPKLFSAKQEIILTDKNYFNDVLEQVFNFVKTDYFIYLKPEEDISLISQNEEFNQPYYYLEVSYFFKRASENVIYQDISDKVVISELRFYNKKHILQYGIENINTDDCHKNIIIENYHSFYEKILTKLLKKHITILKNKEYRSDSIIYMTNHNIKLFSSNQFNTKFRIYKNPWLKMKESFKNNTQSTEYISILINLAITDLYNNGEFAFNELIELEQNHYNNSLVLYMIAKFYELKTEYLKSIEYLEKINSLKSNFNKYSHFVSSIPKYYSFYQIGKMYIKLSNIEKAIENFEICLNSCSDRVIIDELNIFIENNRNQVVEANFSCQTCGNCCRTKLINLTHNDAKKILDNRSDLNINDFIDYINIDKNTEDYNHGDKFISEGHKEMMILKKKESKNECIFLDSENKCSINDFKPLACKAWPFVIRETDNKLMWSIHEREFIKNNCSHTLIENNNVAEIENTVKNLKNDRSSFFETIYKWNHHENDNNEKFIDYALKNSNQNILDHRNNINQKIINIFSEDKNVSLIEENTFTSIYFKQTNNTFSYGLYLNDLTSFSNNENLERVKDSLSAQSYSISTQPDIYVSFYINNSDTKYIINVFPYLSQNAINVSKQSNILFKKKLIKINKLANKSMFDLRIDYLRKRFNFICLQDYNNVNPEDFYNNMNNTIFSLISWLNQKEFTYLKYNLLDYLPTNFNDYLLSNTKKIETERHFKIFIFNSKDIFYSVIKLYQKYNLDLTLNISKVNQVF